VKLKSRCTKRESTTAFIRRWSSVDGVHHIDEVRSKYGLETYYLLIEHTRDGERIITRVEPAAELRRPNAQLVSELFILADSGEPQMIAKSADGHVLAEDITVYMRFGGAWCPGCKREYKVITGTVEKITSTRVRIRRGKKGRTGAWRKHNEVFVDKDQAQGEHACQ
tara:strand:- start:3063 stop:3563 length:501 start_codon:yes stop_codon:yes gene_type:complete